MSSKNLASYKFKKYYFILIFLNLCSVLDFVIQKGLDIIPIEVKISTHTKARSLDLYMKTYNPNYAIRISEKNFGFENNIKSVPLYAVFCI